jgi:hypothetical protein
LLFSRKPVMSGSMDFAVPSLLSLTTTTSPPALLDLFQDPCRATMMAFL